LQDSDERDDSYTAVREQNGDPENPHGSKSHGEAKASVGHPPEKVEAGVQAFPDIIQCCDMPMVH